MKIIEYYEQRSDRFVGYGIRLEQADEELTYWPANIIGTGLEDSIEGDDYYYERESSTLVFLIKEKKTVIQMLQKYLPNHTQKPWMGNTHEVFMEYIQDYK